MSSQATAWHHITGRTQESLLVKLKYYIEPSVKDTQITNFTEDPSIKLIVSFYAVAQRTVSLWQPFGRFWTLHKHTLRRHIWFFLYQIVE